MTGGRRPSLVQYTFQTGGNMDLEVLRQQHAELDRKIKEGYSHYLDDQHLQKMKHEKLTLKRKITQYESSHNN